MEPESDRLIGRRGDNCLILRNNKPLAIGPVRNKTMMTKHIDDLVSHAGAVVHDLRAILMDAEITPDELELAQSAAKALAEVLGGMSCTLTVRMARRRAA
jgi:hypothetical protein